MDEILEGVCRQGDRQARALQTLRREGHTLKGLAGSFGFPLVSVIGHRMEG